MSDAPPADRLRERLQTLRRRGPIIVAHRGTAVGMAAENTLSAVRTAIRSGSDMVEVDLSVSTDGVSYLFHDGEEPVTLGIDANLTQLPSADIDELRHVRSHRPSSPRPVPRLAAVAGELRALDVLLNLDRSWQWWPSVLDELRDLQLTGQTLVKCPATDDGAMAVLRGGRGADLGSMVICRSVDELEKVLAEPPAGLVAVELVGAVAGEGLCTPAAVDRVHSADLLTFVNSEVLNTDEPLFGGCDDERAVLDGPAAAWEPLIHAGVDLIQTDLPWLLARYLSEHPAACSSSPGEPMTESAFAGHVCTER